MVYAPANSFHVADTFLHKHQWICLPNLSCQFRYSVGASMGQPDTRWSIALVCLSHTLHFRSAPFSNMFAWKFLSGRLWSCDSIKKPTLSDFRPDKASHWWFSEKFTSRSLAQIGHLPWGGFSFHPSFSSLIFLVFANVLICFAFSVEVEFAEMLSVLRLIPFKYFFALVVIECKRLFSSCFLQAWVSNHLFCLNKCLFQ